MDKKTELLPQKKATKSTKKQQKRKRDHYYFLNYYYYVQNAKTKDKKLCLHFNFYITTLSFRTH